MWICLENSPSDERHTECVDCNFHPQCLQWKTSHNSLNMPPYMTVDDIPGGKHWETFWKPCMLERESKALTALLCSIYTNTHKLQPGHAWHVCILLHGSGWGQTAHSSEKVTNLPQNANSGWTLIGKTQACSFKGQIDKSVCSLPLPSPDFTD